VMDMRAMKTMAFIVLSIGMWIIGYALYGNAAPEGKSGRWRRGSHCTRSPGS
jgi:hypothetical protein